MCCRVYGEVCRGGPCVPSPVPLPDELHDLTVVPDAEMCARKNAGLSRKKHRTLQEETPDSPGRNTGLSRKKHRTLQGIRSKVFPQTIGFCKRSSCLCLCVVILFVC